MRMISWMRLTCMDFWVLVIMIQGYMWWEMPLWQEPRDHASAPGRHTHKKRNSKHNNRMSRSILLKLYNAISCFNKRLNGTFPWYLQAPLYLKSVNGPLTRYAKLRVVHAPGMPGTFSPPPLVSDPDMHHGTCLTHVPWCMPGLRTSGFLWNRWRGKRSRHFRRMRNPQFWVSGKRPMGFYLVCWLKKWVSDNKYRLDHTNVLLQQFDSN